MTKQVKRGRPMLDRETVQERLAQFGWEIPLGVKYRGTDKPHTLQCKRCGYITERMIHNVVYRGDVCPMRNTHGQQQTQQSVVVDNNTTHRDRAFIEHAVETAVSKSIGEIVKKIDEQQEVILSTAINREDLISKFLKMYSGTVSRKGYLEYNRAMTTSEWFDASDRVATQLINRLDPKGMTDLLTNYAYHRAKSPTVKPEKVLLMVMSKTQLFRALEQVQLIRVML